MSYGIATGVCASMVARGGGMQQTIVKKYKGERKYKKDADKMAKAGFRVVNVVDQGKPAWRFLIGGTGVKRRLLVTYSKDA